MKKILILILSLCIYKINAQQSYSYSESGFQQLEEIFREPQYIKTNIIEGLPKNITELEENEINEIIYNPNNKELYKYNGIKEWLRGTLTNISPEQFFKTMHAYLKHQNVKIAFTSKENEELLRDNIPLIKKSFNRNNPPENYEPQFNEDEELIDISEQYKQVIYAGDATIYEPIFKTEDQPLIKKISINSDDKIYCIGDIHGYFRNLIFNLDYLSKKNILNFENLKLKANNYLIFSGDYADRGSAGIETIFMVLLLKLFNPNQVFLVKGNHEEFNFIPLIPQNEKSITTEIAHQFLSSETKHISTVLLNYLELVYSSLPYYLIAENSQNEKQSLLICHGDNKSNWNDIYPSYMFFNQELAQTPSHRGPNLIIRNSKFISKELRKKGISIMIKGHDHTMPKNVQFGSMQKPNAKQNIKGKPIINPILPYTISVENIRKPSLGAVNIGTKKFPIIVNISGSMQGIAYYPTMVEIKPDKRFSCGWNYKIINSIQ